MDGVPAVGEIIDHNSTDDMYLIRISSEEGDVGWFWADDVEILSAVEEPDDPVE